MSNAWGTSYIPMFDFMINHISRQSKILQGLPRKARPKCLIRTSFSTGQVLPENRPTQADVDLIYKRKDRAPKQEITFVDGTTEHLWNTFGEEQIDLDVTK